MGLFDLIAHWRRLRHVRQFERYIQQTADRYRYDPKPALKEHGITNVSNKGQGTVLMYCPEAKKLYYFGHSHVDPALVRVAETMLVIHLESGGGDGTTSYIVTTQDVADADGPSDNQRWLHYMQALDRLMPIDVVQAIHAQILTQDNTQLLAYAYCRIFYLPINLVMKRHKDATLDVHHQTSFTSALTLLKDKLSHDPRIVRSEHPPSSP